MPSVKDFKERIESEAKAAMPIRNKDLICKDCILRFDDSEIPGNTSKCEVYNFKPNEVITKGKCLYHTSKEAE